MKINITKSFFADREQLLLTHGEFNVTAFKYSTGVEALRVENSKGYFIILPFKGQQLWKLNFNGTNLSMKTTINEPVPTKDYLKTYGGFLYHCGICSFGAPDEIHPQHGELPNADYNSAYISCGKDEKGKYIAVGGTADYDVAFTKKYRFSPECRLYEGETVLKISVSLENMRNDPMEYMYLCHINFKPIDGAKLICSAETDSRHIKVYRAVGENVPKEKALKLNSYFDRLEKNPEIHTNVGSADEAYDPEICFGIRYSGDKNGRAYSMQYKEGFGACYVSHPTDILPYAIRWISRTDDEDSMGMVLPATGEHLGYKYAKENGQIRFLAPHERLEFYIEAGYIDGQRSEAVLKKISEILK